jgi:hypothetical protein
MSLDMRTCPCLEIETSSYCNRKCPTCVRNSNPNRDALAERFTWSYMDMDTILDLVWQAHALGFRNSICLSHFNEPLLDPRLPEIARSIRQIGQFRELFLHSNADALTEDMAAELDGLMDRIVFAVYIKNDHFRMAREEWIASLFKHTFIQFTGGIHRPVPYAEVFPLEQLIASQIDTPCLVPTERLVVDYRGQVHLCCADVIDTLGLPSFPESSVAEIVANELLNSTIDSLSQAGGRRHVALCQICPAPGGVDRRLAA